MLGVVIGMAAAMALLNVVHRIYPTPEQLDAEGNPVPLDDDAERAFIATLPLPALLLTLAVHQLGAVVGGAATVLLARRRWLTGPLMVGAVFLVAGVANLFLQPAYPLWFAIANILLSLPTAVAGGWIACRLLPQPPAYTMADIPPHLRQRRR